MAVAGASAFRYSAILANTQQRSAQSASLLTEAAGGLSLLDVARSNRINGLGISSSARALNKQILSSSAGAFNQIFSAGAGGDDPVESARIQINALRSKLSDNELSPSLRGNEVDQEV